VAGQVGLMRSLLNHVISLPRTGRSIVKQEGDLLWPDREGRAELTAAKHRLGSFGYASQYLQNPIARGGNLFKEKWFGTYRCGALLHSRDFHRQ
jgi:hypothetical protein